jgi:large subunit ribosomal protein LP0
MWAGAAGAPVPVREGCDADGQGHHDAQGHSGQLENNLAPQKLLSHILGMWALYSSKRNSQVVAMVLAPLHCVQSLCRLVLEKTSLFQNLGVITKFSRGTIENLNDVHLIKTGDKSWRQ